MTENSKLNSFLLQSMDNMKSYSVRELQKGSEFSMIEVKEALLCLLQQGKVQNLGAHWKRVADQESQQIPEQKKLYVRCPRCNTKLIIEEGYIEMRVSCCCCDAHFYISSRQIDLNEFEAIPEKEVYHE